MLRELDRKITRKQAELRSARAERRQGPRASAAGGPVAPGGSVDSAADRAQTLRALDDRLAARVEEIGGAKLASHRRPAREQAPEPAASLEVPAVAARRPSGRPRLRAIAEAQPRLPLSRSRRAWVAKLAPRRPPVREQTFEPTDSVDVPAPRAQTRKPTAAVEAPAAREEPASVEMPAAAARPGIRDRLRAVTEALPRPPLPSRRWALVGMLVAAVSAGGLLTGSLTDSAGEGTAVTDRAAPDRAAPSFADYETALTRQLEVLAATRSSDLTRLREAQAPAAQAAASIELAAAHRRAARSLQSIPAPTPVRSTNDSLVAALTTVANAYLQLADSADSQDRSAYGAGQFALRRAEATLQRRLTAISAL